MGLTHKCTNSFKCFYVKQEIVYGRCKQQIIIIITTKATIITHGCCAAENSTYSLKLNFNLYSFTVATYSLFSKDIPAVALTTTYTLWNNSYRCY